MADPDQQLSPTERALETFWAILQNATLRAVTLPMGRSPADLTAEDVETLLRPYRDALANDYAQCREVARAVATLEMERVHRELHGQPGVDHEMLDEAIEFHTTPADHS